VSVGLAPHFGAIGEFIAVSAIIRDISESKAIQRLQSEFLAMTSHELRTPLTSIRGHAQLMLRRGAFEQAYLEVIVSAADQLGLLVEDLLLASRLEADRFDLRRQELDIREVVQTTVNHLIGASGRTIQAKMPAQPLVVWGDRLRLGQVFANLLSNAVKYSAENTEIVVQVTHSPSLVSVAVIDRGAGIPADDMPHLFDRFYRVAETAEQVQGVGLGLYIAHRLVRAHGGNLEVESEVHHGSVFTVSLPLHGEPNDDMVGRPPRSAVTA
jgi:two-component system, OmpR family, phosphate regulon sensor histidine kinase PhoR